MSTARAAHPRRRRARRRGWKRLARAADRAARLLLRAVANFLSDDGFDRCAAISYFALFSFVPFLSLAALLGGWILGSSDWLLNTLLFGLEEAFPTAGDQAAGQARAAIERQGTIVVLMLPLLVWTSHYAASSVETSMNHVLRTREHRRYLKAKMKSFALLAVGGFCLLLIPTMQQLGVVLRRILPAVPPLEWVVQYRLLTEAGLLLAGYLTFAFTLIYVPAVRSPARPALLVAGVAAICWQASRLVVSRLLVAAAGPTVASGSFSFVIATLLWVYATSLILLMAAELLALLTGRR